MSHQYAPIPCLNGFTRIARMPTETSALGPGKPGRWIDLPNNAFFSLRGLETPHVAQAEFPPVLEDRYPKKPEGVGEGATSRNLKCCRNNLVSSLLSVTNAEPGPFLLSGFQQGGGQEHTWIAECYTEIRGWRTCPLSANSGLGRLGLHISEYRVVECATNRLQPTRGK